MKKKIFFRADGDPNVGLGHVIRSLALAEMIQENFDIVFITRTPDDKVFETIKKYTNNIITIPVIDTYNEEARNLLSEGHVQKGDIVVLDGYKYGIFYQEILRKGGCKIVSVDDIHTNYFAADIIINHGGKVLPTDYHSSPYTQFALGTKYVLLRSAFYKEYPSKNGVTSTFVCLGGSDPQNHTLEVLKVLAEKQLTQKINVVIGSQYPHRATLEKFIEEKNISAYIHENASAEEMAAMMSLSDIGICTASSVAYEYAAIQGGLFVVRTVENQKEIYDFLLEAGLAEKFENFDKSVNLDALIANQKELFDGKSPERFLKLFEELCVEKTVKIRKATFGDLKQYFNWANEPEVRQASYNMDQISMETHTNWYEEKLKSEGTYLYVLSDEKYDVGQIRFDIKQGEAVISYSVDKRHRGRGLGTILLKKGIEQFCLDHQGAEPIVGFVKQSSKASNKTFQKFRFIKDDKILPGSYKYILKR